MDFNWINIAIYVVISLIGWSILSFATRKVRPKKIEGNCGDLEYDPESAVKEAERTIAALEEPEPPSNKVVYSETDWDDDAWGDSHYKEIQSVGIDVTDKVFELGVPKYDGFKYVFFQKLFWNGEHRPTSLVLMEDSQIYFRQPMTPSLTPDVEFKKAGGELSRIHQEAVKRKEEAEKAAEQERMLRESLLRFAEGNPMAVIGESQKWVNDDSDNETNVCDEQTGKEEND